MTIPGSNLLNMAFTIIAEQPVIYSQYISRSITAIGTEVATYADPVTIYGSWQTVPRAMYEKYGLDLNKFYATFYTSNDILDVQRDVSGDQMQFNGSTWQCLSSNDWFAVDGWVGVLVVQLQ